MKVIAMYLPQFHRVKENDEWWGEGFTEWTAAQSAEVLFEGHKQPHKPLNEFYYDLMEKQTMQWQADLMKRYGVDGLCFYHYYFREGRMILEKPAENLLEWKDVDMPFCFSWANESWISTWSNITEGNVWSRVSSVDQNGMSDILLEQSYGNENDWEKHFYYLLPFFKDSRYIKKDGHPVFLIYRTSKIYCLDNMLDVWNDLAKKEGIPSIYIIGSNVEKCQEGSLDEIVLHEPQNTLRKFPRTDKDVPRILDYDDVWEQLLSIPITSEKVFRGSFVNYDDTPRHGKKGTIINNGSPEKFLYYLTRLFAEAKNRNKELIFINAWNEWGEGMYLEPDEEYGYQYLEMIKRAKERAVTCNKSELQDDTLLMMAKELDDMKKRASRYKKYWEMLEQLLLFKEQKKSISYYFIKNGMSNIAIYGIGMLGKHIVQDLKCSEIVIRYGIDKKEKLNFEFPVYSLDDELEEVDVIVVTVGYEFRRIKDSLKKKVDCKIISLEEIIEEIKQY